MRLLWMGLLAIAPAWACSCIGTATPCSEVGGDSVIFVARVLVDSGEYPGTRPAKVEIEEVLQNVPKGLREVEIDTMAGTSCYRQLQAGERYVIITRGSHYSAAGCNPSFRLRGSEHILDAMRAQIKGGSSRLVGTVLKSVSRFNDEGGIGAAIVTATAANGVRHQTTTDGFGHFTIPGLAPGSYKIEASKPGFVPDPDHFQAWGATLLNTGKPESGAVAITPNACTLWDVAMWPAGRVQGTVRSREGVPVHDVTVQAFAFDNKKKREGSPLRTAKTAADGSYTLQPLPQGNYVVGVNGDEYEDNDAYPPTFYADGKSVYIAEAGSANGIDFVVPPPRTAARLKVTVLGPDGRPYEGANVRLDTHQGQQRQYNRDKSNKDGQITVPAYIGERYSVRASNFVTVDRKLIELQGVASIELVDPNQSVTIALQEVKKMEIPQVTIK